jgi:hypothetical protein
MAIQPVAPPRPEELAIEAGLQVGGTWRNSGTKAVYLSFVPREQAVLRVESIKGIQKAGHLVNFAEASFKFT